jgi:hypothetical protein
MRDGREEHRRYKDRRGERRGEERRFLFCSIGGNRIRDGGRERERRMRERRRAFQGEKRLVGPYWRVQGPLSVSA